MNKLLLPGLRFKRWILLTLVGFLALAIFFVLAFGDELLLLFQIIDIQLAKIFNLEPGAITIKLIIEILLFIGGLVFVVIGLKRIGSFFIDTLMPEKKGKIAHLLYKSAQLKQAPNIVTVGGGTGLFSLLTGLKRYTNNISSIVTMSDMGSRTHTSTGRLRADFDMLPPGDVRQCLVALSDSGQLMSDVLQYRFKEGTGLKGHAFGNILLTVLTKVTGSFEKAMAAAHHILAIRGKVIPVTLDNVHLCARLENGKIVKREHHVEESKRKYGTEIKELFLEPRAHATKEAIKALKEADLIVLGPGSLYTSIIPNLLVDGIPEAIRASKAKKVYICNVMTQPGETDDYTASDHMSKIVHYLGENVLDGIIVNTARAPEHLYKKYKKEGARRVKFDEYDMKRFNAKIVKADLMTTKNLLRHDPEKLAKTILRLCE
ncbi:YvcK family protein [Candidatus Woesearchaeota archaeon]|nr:YvcK family protein [Candidatus Woesearchaeota archaeon]